MTKLAAALAAFATTVGATVAAHADTTSDVATNLYCTWNYVWWCNAYGYCSYAYRYVCV